jgi:hypothetical protein
MDWHPLAQERLTEEERERWSPAVVPLDEWIVGGEKVFDGYEDSFWAHGGRVGGW